MIRVEIIKDYMEHYKIDSNVNSIEDVAKILVKCKLLDSRNNKYNLIGYSYEELLYNELMDIKEQICFLSCFYSNIVFIMSKKMKSYI